MERRFLIRSERCSGKPVTARQIRPDTRQVSKECTRLRFYLLTQTLKAQDINKKQRPGPVRPRSVRMRSRMPSWKRLLSEIRSHSGQTSSASLCIYSSIRQTGSQESNNEADRSIDDLMDEISRIHQGKDREMIVIACNGSKDIITTSRTELTLSTWLR
jgi:hypothetical protein